MSDYVTTNNLIVTFEVATPKKQLLEYAKILAVQMAESKGENENA